MLFIDYSSAFNAIVVDYSSAFNTIVPSKLIIRLKALGWNPAL
jgi:hypothetical protein